MAARHKITEVDVEHKRGVCSVCGPTDITSGARYKGKRYWRCGTLRRQDAVDYRSREDVRTADRQRRLLRSGVTIAQFDEMLAQQDGKCARCLQPSATLSVDFDQAASAPRRLLCKTCKRYINMLEASRSRLQQDLFYLDNGHLDRSA